MRLRPWLSVLALLFVTGVAGAETPLWDDNNVPPAVQAKLNKGQDLAMDKQFTEAEAMIREAMQEIPEHPVGWLFLIATELGRIQEGFKAAKSKVPDDFFKDADHLVDMGQAQLKLYPKSADTRVYLGAAFGIRGLAKLYAGSYLASYRDGKRGAAYLKEAVTIDDKTYNAYMGLGQFEYYCGTLSGVLQFVLALPGSPDKGLDMLKTCEEKGTYAAWPCRSYRVKLQIADRKDFKNSADGLVALVERYPHNDEHALGVFEALKADVNTPALRRSAETVLSRLDQGWSPPAYSQLQPHQARLTLAKAYLMAGDPKSARKHLEHFRSMGPSPIRAEAMALLEPMASLAPTSGTAKP